MRAEWGRLKQPFATSGDAPATGVRQSSRFPDLLKAMDRAAKHDPACSQAGDHNEDVFPVGDVLPPVDEEFLIVVEIPADFARKGTAHGIAADVKERFRLDRRCAGRLSTSLINFRSAGKTWWMDYPDSLADRTDREGCSSLARTVGTAATGLFAADQRSSGLRAGWLPAFLFARTGPGSPVVRPRRLGFLLRGTGRATQGNLAGYSGSCHGSGRAGRQRSPAAADLRGWGRLNAQPLDPNCSAFSRWPMIRNCGRIVPKV